MTQPYSYRSNNVDYYTASDINVLQDGIEQISYNVKAPNFGALGDGITSDAARIQACIDAANAAGGGVVYLPPGTYVLDDQIVLYSNITLAGAGNSSVIKQTATMVGQTGTALVYAAGTSDYTAGVAFTSNQAAGAFSITLPTGQGANYATGEWIVLESQLIIQDDGSNPALAKEAHRIYAVSSDTLYLNDPLQWAYTTSDTAKFYKKVVLSNIGIRDLKFTSAAPLTTLGYQIRLNFVTNIAIKNVTIENAGGGLYLYGCHHATIDNYHCHKLPNGREPATNASLGYGLTLDDDSSEVTINSPIMSDCRHAMSTLPHQRSGGGLYGGPRNVTVNGGIAIGEVSGLSIWDTHIGGANLVYNNCIGYGAKSDGTDGTGSALIGGASAGYCWQVRSQYVYLNNCIGWYSGDRGVSCTAGSSNVHINGGEFAYNGLNAISLSASCSVRNANIHHNGQSGISLSSTADDCVITGNHIHDNSTTIAGFPGIEVAGGLRCVITGNIIPFSSTQGKAFLNLYADAVVFGNVLTGHGFATAFNTSGVSYAPMSYPQWNYAPLIPQQFMGTGTPEAKVTARVGSIYQRVDGGASTSLYIKESGVGNTGWRAV